MVATGMHRKSHRMDRPQISTSVLSQAHIPFSGLKKFSIAYITLHFCVSALPTDWRFRSAPSGSRRTNSLSSTSTT